MQKTIKQQEIDHVLHPFVQYPSFNETGPMIIDKGEGCYVYDDTGRRYFDGMGGLWCVNIGYGRKEMADAVAEQITQLPFYNTFSDMSNTPTARLASKLIEHAPSNFSHVFFTTGGSMANDTAIRLAHYYFHLQNRPNKKKIISRVDAYHGSTYLAAALTGIESYHNNFNIMSHEDDTFIHYLSSPNVYRRPAELDEAAFCAQLVAEFEAKIAQLGADNIAAFIAEPIMGAGGVLVAPEHYYQKMWQVCQQHDILFIADEVVTAFGRLGHMFACEAVFQVQPDLISVAKGISSGYIPLGATLVSKKIHAIMSRDATDNQPFSHGFTYSCHPVACAAGLKNIEIIERENLCEQAREVGDYFEQRLHKLIDKPLVGNVRGKRLMMCVELVEDKAQKKPFPAAQKIGEQVAEHVQANGLIARNVGDFIILSPPLTMTHEQADFVVDTLSQAIDAVTARL